METTVVRCFICTEVIDEGEGRTEPPLNVHVRCYDEAHKRITAALKKGPGHWDGHFRDIQPDRGESDGKA